MKKILILLALILTNYYSFSQCTNASSYGSAVAPTVTGTPTTISTCSYQTEYSTITAVAAGATYSITNNLGGCVTIHSGTPAGPIVAFGPVPFSWTPAAGGTYYFHWNTNCAPCGTATACGTTTITLTSGGGPPPAPCTGGANNSCLTADPFCTGTAYNYCNSTGVASAGTFGCLFSTPNPMWMYLNIATSGSISIYMEQFTTAGLPIDVDFAIYGPYGSLGAACPITGATPQVDCSYSAAATETGTIPAAVAGQFYMLLITNFNGSAGYIEFSQSGGTGTTNCAIVVPCSVTATGTNPLCAGGTGSILVTATGGTANYNVSWTGPSSGNPGGWEMNATGGTYTIPALAPGSYVVTLTDATGCVTTQNVTITNPTPVVATQVHVNPPCFGGTTTATITGSGSTAPYNVSWTGTTTGNPAGTEIAASGGTYNMTGLGVGTYNVTVTSANGCTGTVTVTVTTPPVLTATDVETNVSCFGGTNGNGAITATGGTAPYNVSWTGTTSGNPAGTEIAASGGTYNMSGLVAGTYNVTVTDANGCTATTTVNIAPGVVITAGFTINDNTQCLTGNNFVFTNTGSVGVYSWNFGDAGTSTAQNPSHTYAAAGTYVVTHTVTSGPCSATTTQNVTVYPMPLPISTSTPVSCFGGSNGTATVTTPVGPGPGPFSYSWAPSGQVTNPATGLTAGSYTCTVTDQTTGCTGQTTVTVATPPVLTATDVETNVSCFGGTNGNGAITATGGTAPYNVSWTGTTSGNPAGTEIAASGGTYNMSGLVAGTYNVTVTDANGCTATTTVNIAPGVVITAGFTINDNTQCLTGNNFVFTNTGSVGVYSWNFGDAGTSTAQNPSHTYGAAGTYVVTHTVTSGPCSATTTQNVTVYPMPLPVALADSVNCFGGSTGFAQITNVTNSAGPFTYSWNSAPVQTTQTATGLPAGTYTCVVTDQITGCTGQVTVTVYQPAVVTASEIHVNPTCNGFTNGTATATGAGGTPGYTYSWNTVPVQNTQTATGLAVGSYTCTVTDANGCTTTVVSTLTQPAPIVLNPTMTPANCGLPDGATNVTVTSGGVGPFSYSWNTVPVQNTQAAINVPAGTYTVVVTDQANGCTQDTTITVTTTAGITATAVFISDALCNGANNGSAYAFPTGGAPVYSYSWNTVPVQTNDTLFAGAGTYTVVITDGSGCTGNASVTINEPTLLTASITGFINASCFGSADGTATAAGAGGTPNYTYSWNTVPVQNTQTATGLAAGTYTCTVTDNNGCITTINVTILDGILITAGYTLPANQCLTGNSFTFTNTGTTGGFTSYSWDFGNGVGTSTLENPTYTYPASGTYNVQQIVYNGVCADTVTQSITVYPMPVPIAIADSVLCNGGNTGSATVNAPIYSGYLWSNAQTTNPAINLIAGTYSVTVTDANGCQAITTATVFEPTPVVASVPGSTNLSCFGANDGTATAGGSGGTPGYTYSWNTVPVQNTQTATGLAPGTYTVTVTDGNGCTSTAPITILNGPLMTSSVTGTDVTCFGGNNGSANLTVNGGTAPYTYSWTPSGSASEDPNGLVAGWHFVTVTSQEGCVVVDSILITQPLVLVAVIDSSFDVSCFGYADGSAYASASGGTLPYSYSWNTVPVQTNPNAITLSFGLYTFTVTDANGCQASAIATINQPPALAAITGDIPAYCGVDQGSVWAFPTNGTAPYTYSWDSAGVSIGVGDTLSGLYPGTYGLILEDANSCKLITTVTVTALPGGTASISSFTDALCFGSNDGTATVSVGGAFPGFTYQWNAAAGNQTTNPAIGLGIGTYSVIVTDALGCVMNTSVTIGQPAALTLSLSSTSKICPDACNASIVSNPGGGVGPYTYSWNTIPVQIVPNAASLCPGTYTLVLTDNNGCTISDSATILNPPVMVMSNTITPANCNQPDGGATANVTANGTAPYTYSWSDGISVVGTGTSLSNVFAGTYYVTAFDSLGCSITDTIIIPNLSGPIITIDSVYDVLCNGGNTGYAEVQVTGGTFPYAYSWNTVPVQNTPSASNLTAGSYTFMVADSNGCTASTVININEPTPIALITGGVDPSCFNYINGSTWVNASGGVAPYSYSWNTIPIQTNDTANGLPSGSYTVTVVDDNNCFEVATVTLNNPLLFSVNVTGYNVSCFNSCDGSASTALTNGIAPFTYLWDDPGAQTNDSIFGLCDGNVNVIVTDAMGCITNGGVVITEPALLVATENSHGDVSCAGGNNGFSSVNVVGGTGPYTYNWDLSGSTVSTSQAANNLVAGSYLVTVTDDNGCTDQITVVITEPNPLNVIVSATDADCFGANTGSAFVTVIGGTGPYSSQWNDPALQQTDTAFNLLANIAPGYSVTVTDALGCTLTVNNILVDQPTQLVINTSTVSSTCGANNGSATVSVGGGTPNYSYNWNTIPAQSTLTASNINAGNYIVIVTDANGCTDSTTANVNDLGGPTVTIPTFTNVSCNGAADGTAQSNVVGGTMPYTYSWNTSPIQTTPNATGLNAQTYSVTVTDSNGCITAASITINQNLGLNAVINASTNVSCFGLSDGQASVIGGGGGAPYTYSWNTVPVQTTPTATGLAAGTYIVTLSDTNLCTAKDTIIITQPALLTVTLDSLSDVKCNGGNTGYINIVVTGGTLGYSYLWAPNVSSGATAAGLIAGNYNVTVTDANGCSVSGNYDVFEPAQLVIGNVTVPSTCGALNGSATVNIVTNSTPNYTYSWNTTPVQNTPTATNLAASSYVVTVTDANGCLVTQNVTVTNIPGPVIDSIITTPVGCFGGNNGTAIVYTTGSDPFTYQWSDPSSQSTQMATGLLASPPIYTVIVTDVNGCSTMGVTQITQPAQLTALINSPDTICFGQPVQLFANANGGTPAYSFLWGGGQIGQGPIVTYPITSTVYNVNVIDASGCQANATKMVIVRAQPQFTVADQTICQGELATLTPTNINGGNTNNPFNFFWMQIDSLSGSLSSTGVMNPVNPLTVGPANTTNYVVWINDGCSSVDTLGVTVFVNDTATGQLVPVMDTCQGIVQYFALTTDIGVSFGWDFNSDGIIDKTTTTTTTTYIYPSAGTYDLTVTITTAQGCVSIITQPNWVTVHPNPIADFTTNPNPPEVTLLNPTFNFIDQSFGADFWYWTFGDLTSDSINQNPTHTYQDTGYYNVVLLVTNIYGCTDMTSKVVRVRPDFFFVAPNTFTPNGDGVNDIFFPGTMLGASVKNYNFFIFDRWGEVIFEGHDLRDGWDGTYKGKLVQNGVYVWTIEVTDLENTVHQYVGHVNVLH